jgi:putative ABC transport system ATP-binding protein
VIDLLAGLAARRGTTVIVATHNAELAARAPLRLAMRDGRIVSGEGRLLTSNEAAVQTEVR